MGQRSANEELTMAKPTVVVVGADKGGVGKTTVARTLLDYFTAHHVPTRAFDSETPKGTLKRFHPDITDSRRCHFGPRPDADLRHVVGRERHR